MDLADGRFAEHLQYLAADPSHPHDEDLRLGEGGIAAVDQLIDAEAMRRRDQLGLHTPIIA